MSTPEAKRTRAAQLYLMAADAFARDNPALAEQLVAKANQYADEAAAEANSHTTVQQQQQPRRETEGGQG